MYFRIYKRGNDGVLHHAQSGLSLGASHRDVGFIVDGATAEIEPGDVLEIEGDFLMIKSIEPVASYRDPSQVDYVYLSRVEDHEHQFGDGPWSQQIVTRLQHEARVCEEMSK